MLNPKKFISNFLELRNPLKFKFKLNSKKIYNKKKQIQRWGGGRPTWPTYDPQARAPLSFFSPGLSAQPVGVVTITVLPRRKAARHGTAPTCSALLTYSLAPSTRRPRRPLATLATPSPLCRRPFSSSRFPSLLL